MTKISPYLIENPNSIKPSNKPLNNCPRKWISLLPIIFTILTYIFIFYIFNLTPSSIFKNTKVLFFISNTLILVIAADYGEFTDKEKQDLYQEYAMMTSNLKNSQVFLSQYQENCRRAKIYCTALTEEIKNPAKEVTDKEIICEQTHEKTSEKILEMISENILEKATAEKSKPSENANAGNTEGCDARNRENPKPSCRSKSRKTWRARSFAESSEIKGKEKNDKGKVYERSKSEGSKCMNDAEKWENVEEETEEFSKMSNEELNRRVEEFIQRFNTQIKIQGLRNRQILYS